MTQLLRARRLLTGQGWLDDHQLRIHYGDRAHPLRYYGPRRGTALSGLH